VDTCDLLKGPVKSLRLYPVGHFKGETIHEGNNHINGSQGFNQQTAAPHISEPLCCNLVANKHVGRAEVLRQHGRHTEHITCHITCVICNVHHTAQNSFRGPQALGERG
jgi:hypothetical protein